MKPGGKEELILIEVACALPTRQRLVSLQVATGSTVAQAVDASGIVSAFPELDMATVTYGIFEQPVSADSTVAEGDRVTLLRPLPVDPKEQRRRRALRQKSGQKDG